MNIIKNTVIRGKHEKPIVVDTFFIENSQPKPMVIFCHGYKGFKDWGAWNVMAEKFAEAGFFFLKFNFSHNGGTVEETIDFPDLEAFGNNNYSIELDDLETVIDWISGNLAFKNEIDTASFSLIGHSRGGGIVTIKSEEDTRIKKVITLAGVSDYRSRFPKEENFWAWKEKGVYYIKNGRTHQEMPHYFQFFEDFEKHEERLTIQRAVSNLNIPHLIVHGDRDTSVSIEEAKIQHRWNPKSRLEIIEGANHVFGTSQPWNSEKLSDGLLKVTNMCIDFLSE